MDQPVINKSIPEEICNFAHSKSKILILTGQIESFNREFPFWEILIEDQDQIKIRTESTEKKMEIPQIVEFFYQTFKDRALSFQIKEGKELIICVRDLKNVKYDRMYTSGCFDIFHYGHLNILRRSKMLCNHLIVGVSTDELIEKEKGKRPVIPYEERARVLQAISYVDQVIPQTDKNKQRIVDEYSIDAISVGDDWKGRYPKVSCEMEYFPYTASVSSTILKDALKLSVKQKD